jgi:hypothetical protein
MDSQSPNGHIAHHHYFRKISGAAKKFYGESIFPFYSAQPQWRQILFVVTFALFPFYVLRGDIFKLFAAVSATFQGEDTSLPALVSLLAETFAIFYCLALFLNSRIAEKEAKQKSLTVYEGMHPCMVPTRVPIYIEKDPLPTSDTSKYGVQRFEDGIDLSSDPDFAKLFEEVKNLRLSNRDLITFTDNPLGDVDLDLSGKQTEIYDLHNKPGENPKTEEPRTLLDLLNEVDEMANDTY